MFDISKFPFVEDNNEINFIKRKRLKIIMKPKKKKKLRWLKWNQFQKLETKNIYKSIFYLGIDCNRNFLLDKYMLMLSKVQIHFINNFIGRNFFHNFLKWLIVSDDRITFIFQHLEILLFKTPHIRFYLISILLYF